MPYRTILGSVSLNPETVRLLFEYNPETGILYRIMVNGELKKIGTPKGVDEHLITQFKDKIYPVTHIIWLWVYGRFPHSGMIVEHEDLNKQNNKLSNLREATQSQNMANTKVTKRSKSGVKGVFWDKDRNKWAVYLTKDYKTHFIGRFDNIEDAKRQHAHASRIFFGEFARVND